MESVYLELAIDTSGHLTSRIFDKRDIFKYLLIPPPPTV